MQMVNVQTVHGGKVPNCIQLNRRFNEDKIKWSPYQTKEKPNHRSCRESSEEGISTRKENWDSILTHQVNQFSKLILPVQRFYILSHVHQNWTCFIWWRWPPQPTAAHWCCSSCSRPQAPGPAAAVLSSWPDHTGHPAAGRKRSLVRQRNGRGI